MRLRSTSALVATALVVAACTDSPVTAPTLTPDAAFSLADQGTMPQRIHRLRTDVQNQGEDAVGPFAAGISYHGGPIIVNPKVVAIYWSNSTIYAGGPAPGTTGAGSADGSLVGHFLRNLGASPYWAINNTYTNSAGSRVAKSLAYTGYWAANVNVPAPGSAPNDNAIIALLNTGFSTGKLTYNNGTIYAVFTGTGVNLGGGFGSQYCAYHTYYNRAGSGAVKYAAQPYNRDFLNGCSAQGTLTPNNDPAADAEVNTLAHELEEAATDPQLNAWYDNQGRENADKCAWTFGTQFTTGNGSKANMTLGGKNFLIQRNWKKLTNGLCALS